MYRPQKGEYATHSWVQSVGPGWPDWCFRYWFSYVLLFSVFSVVGVAKHIDWFGPSGDRIEPNRPDITVTRNDESSSTLTLYKAGTENAGTYKCVATNGDQHAESTVKVKIFRKYFPHLILHSPYYWGAWAQEKKILFIELIVFYWLLKGNTLLFFFSSEDGFFISSINGRKTIRGLLNDPVCCAVLVSNGFYFPWMPSISKCPLEMKSWFLKESFSVTSVPILGYY